MLTLSIIDQETVDAMHKNFPSPDVSKCIIKKCIVYNGDIILVGLVKLSSEIILVSNDKDVSEYIRGKAILKLKDEIRKELEFRRIEECHAFTQVDPHIQNILKKIGFKESKSARIMVLNVFDESTQNEQSGSAIG